MKGFHQVKTWDLVTRLWHWLLAIVVIAGWYLGEFMTFSTIEWHFYCGYTVIGLLLFRYCWGFFGPAPVRYAALLPRPAAVLNYLKHVGKRQPSGTPGHNPLGSLSVIAMLLLLTAQAGSGLFIVSDDFFESGPLAYLVSDAVSNSLTWWHKTLSRWVLAVVGLHLIAILFYLAWKKENLIKPMITGWKWVKLPPQSNSSDKD